MTALRLLFVLLVLAGGVRLAHAEEPYIPDDYALYIYDLEAPALEVPRSFAEGVSAVWLGCEVKGTNLTPYADLGAVRGALGERGQAQIHPVHAEGMAKMGLDFDLERDRVRFGAALYGWHGWSKWSCAKG